MEKDRKILNCGNDEIEGGALYIRLSNRGKCWILNSTFTNCNASNGGAIYAQIDSGAELTIDGLCSFIDCYAQLSGGGLYAQIVGQNSKLLLEDGLIFERCHAGLVYNEKRGGGTYINSISSGSFIINKVSYISCEGSRGGGIDIGGNSSETQKLNRTLFERCNAGSGAGLNLVVINGNANIELISITCVECRGTSGGGLCIDLYYGTQVTLLGQCFFKDCFSAYGGGIYITSSGKTSQIHFLGELEFENCTSIQLGGGIYCSAHDYGLIEINNTTFRNCTVNYSNFGGGGIYAYIGSGGQLIINSCQFINCSSFGGNGGG
ncbi:MAG: hypothetical protein EZS28_050682, partial [Streblomastix strix]